MKKIAVILSGCGFKDGSEITEAISALITLDQAPAEYQIFAPSMDVPSTNHLTGETEDSRNVLVESARIARGKINDLTKLQAKNFDGVVFPGGYGAALHLCNFAQKGAPSDVHPEAYRIIHEFYDAGKPIGAICIAPALIARVLGDQGISVTIGNDADTASEIEKTGAHHVECPVDDYVTDREHKIITTPAYMYEARPSQVFKGIQGALKELVEMA